MEHIIIGFSKAKGFKIFSLAIRWFEKTPYSHTYIAFWSSKYQRWLIYQASKSMVNFMGNDTFLEHNDIIKEFEVPINDIQKTELVQFAIDRMGKPYSLRTILGSFLKQLGWYVPKLFDGEKGYVCSEIVARSLKDVLNWQIHGNIDEITPKQIYDIVNEHCKEFITV